MAERGARRKGISRKEKSNSKPTSDHLDRFTLL